MRELSVVEQMYKAVLAVIAEGRTVTQVARDWDVARQTVHVWLERYEADGLEGLANVHIGQRIFLIRCAGRARNWSFNYSVDQPRASSNSDRVPDQDHG